MLRYDNNGIKVYQGDCFKLLSEWIEQGVKVNAIITDPPYNILKGHKIETIVDFREFAKLSYNLLEKDGWFLFFQIFKCALKMGWFNDTLDVGFEVQDDIIWDKLQGVNFMNTLLRQHETIYTFSKGNAKYNKVYYNKLMLQFENQVHKGNFYERLSRHFGYMQQLFSSKELILEYVDLHFNGVKNYTIPRSDVNDDFHKKSALDKNLSSVMKNAKQAIMGSNLTTIIDMRPHNQQGFNNKAYNIKHPTVKPIQLMELLIELTTNKGDLVCDPFLGSGTTAIACRNTGRRFIGCELDSDYCDIIVERLNEPHQSNVSDFLGG